jgi:hypothetical protein
MDADVVNNVCVKSAERLRTPTPVQLLAQARVAGLSVVADAGRLVVRGPKAAADLARQLIARKTELLPLLPVWDQAEANRLLSEARGAAARAEAAYRAGRMTEARRNAVALWRDVCEGYVGNRDLEARRGWDVMELLRGAARHAVEKAAQLGG